MPNVMQLRLRQLVVVLALPRVIKIKLNDMSVRKYTINEIIRQANKLFIILICDCLGNYPIKKFIISSMACKEIKLKIHFRLFYD